MLLNRLCFIRILILSLVSLGYLGYSFPSLFHVKGYPLFEDLTYIVLVP